MQAIPPALQTRFEDHLRSKAIPDPLLWSYRKWLRYYLDYCEKYHFSSRDQNSLPRFIGKLRDKYRTGRGRSSVISVVARNRQVSIPFCQILLPPFLTHEEHSVLIYSSP
jgi:hypothetical protein